MIKDKLPPQAVEMEEAVLGAILLERDAQMISFDLVTNHEIFYKPEHALIFKAVQNLHRRNEPIDILTVTQELRTMGELEAVGGAYYISALTNRIASSANVEHHIRILIQKYISRLVAVDSMHLHEACYDETKDIFTLIARVAKLHDTLLKATSRGAGAKHIGQIINDESSNYDLRAHNAEKGLPAGITTITRGLTRFIGGWQNSDLVIIGARPAMGKTAYALGNALEAAKNNTATLIFSLEMSELQLVQRMIIGESQVDSASYKSARLGNGEIQTVEAAREFLRKQKIFIVDTAAIPIEQMRAIAKRWYQKYVLANGPEATGEIIIDYLQLVTTESRQGNREQEISYISRNCKQMAKDLNVPVLALSQLSRETEKRGGDKRPQLSDLRESGALEQDADIVIFLHRPEYYGMTQTAEGDSTAGLAEFLIAKFRNGSTGMVTANWNERLMKFTDFDEPPSAQFPVRDNANAGLSNNKDFIHQSNNTALD